MTEKNYSKQILDYLTKVKIPPKTSKEILANTNIPKDQINVYLTRLKNRDKIMIIGKRGKFNVYMIGPKWNYKFLFEKLLSIYDNHKDILFPKEKAWLKAYKKEFSINPNI